MLNKDICVDVLDTILVVFCWGFVSFVRSPPAALANNYYGYLQIDLPAVLLTFLSVE